jgi:hypothetical protein
MPAANALKSSSKGDSVTVYAPGSANVTAEINDTDPESLALDSADNLYVGSRSLGVFVYAAGTTTQEFHITDNISSLSALAWAPK